MDVFGTALFDYQNGLRDRPFVTRRDDGFVHTDSVGIWYSERLNPGEAAVAGDIRGRVLDVGCGAGRHILWLQRKGLDVVGIDVSEGAVEVCRRRGCERVHVMNVMEIDPRACLATFETITLFGNNVGIGGTREGVRDLLAALLPMIADDGRLLIASLDVRRTTNPVHLEYQKRNVAAGRLCGQIRMRMEYGSQIGPWIDWVHPLPGELEQLANEAGWMVDQLKALPPGQYGAVLLPLR